MKLRHLTPLALLVGAACSGETAAPVETTTAAALTKPSPYAAEHTHTVKPGANIEFRSELREELFPGDAGAVEITILEGYPGGTMTVTAAASDGIALFTTIDEATFDMSEGRAHDWTVFVDTEEAGRFYVNLVARVDTPIGTFTRTYAAPVQVGPVDKSNAEAAPSQKNAAGQSVIMMQAEETISNQP